jgi:hypothetical protein
LRQNTREYVIINRNRKRTVMSKRPFSFSLFHLLVTLIFGFVSLGFSVNRVLVYHYSGGWYHEEAIPATNQALTELSQEHGFDLVLTEDEADLNLDSLRTFDVIIWNNNVNGASSVQSANARVAVEDYVREGGSWIGISSAGDHLDTWTYLADMIASRFLAHGEHEDNMVAVDDEALADPELQQALTGIPAQETLYDEWFSFTVNVRGQPGITVIYSLLESENPNFSGPEMGDHPYVWVNKNPDIVGQGMAIYDAIGHSRADIYTQKDGFAKKLLWALVQYAAGDFSCTPGCPDPLAINYDSLATCGDSSSCEYAPCCALPGYVEYDPYCTNHSDDECGLWPNLIGKLNKPFINISSEGISITHLGKHSIQVFNVNGEKVISGNSKGPDRYSLSDLESGLYFIKVDIGKQNFLERIFIQ